MQRSTLVLAGFTAVFVLALLGFITVLNFLPSWILWLFALGFGAVVINALLGNPIPFLRWSFLRMIFGMKKLTTDWQVGDGREERVLKVVLEKAEKGNAEQVTRVIDEFGWKESLLMNVGDTKGAILDACIDRCSPKIILELGCYVGYSSIRMAQRIPQDGKIFSIEFNKDNAGIARQIIEHAGLSSKIEVIHGYLGDGGKTADYLTGACSLAGKVDFVFIDHAKEAYLPDLHMIMEQNWLHKGSVVVADNIKFPGSPEYHSYMDSEEGKKRWNTQAHKSYVEYQSVIPDILLESEYLG